MGKDKLGEIEFGRYHQSFDNLAQIIFIRHGEKISDDYPDLSPQGYFRARNLWKIFGPGRTPPGAYNTPDVIYAMKKGEKDRNSNRPFETVEPLAAKSSDTPNLGMDPVMDERTTQGGVFDNTFLEDEHMAGSQPPELKRDLVGRAKEEYKGKTIMICWEHKNIPYIVAKFGLTTQTLDWGLNPLSGADAGHNFSAIWVFTPGKSTFQVFHEFDVVPEGLLTDNHLGEIHLSSPEVGYGKAVFSQDLNCSKDGGD